MDWSKDSLLSKAKIFFEKAFNEEDRDNIFFGLFCSIGLELLERASISKISPTLLAEQDDFQRHILYALGHQNGSSDPKSIITSKVIALCEKLVPEYDSECKNVSIALANRRNAEAHSGGLAFCEYNTDKWLSGFFYTTKILSQHLDISLKELFDEDIAKEAEIILSGERDKLIHKVNKEIANRKSVYESDRINNPDLLNKKIEKNEIDILFYSHKGYHHVLCPACGNKATIYGTTYGKEKKIIHDDCIETLFNVTPTEFECQVCGLKLTSHQELKIAGLPLHYNRKVVYSPEDYYGLSDLINQSTDHNPWEDYSNE